MRFILPAFVSLLATAGTAMADRVELNWACGVGSCWPVDQGKGGWEYNDGVWQTFWGLPGCTDRWTGIADLAEWCFDTGNGRAHFRFRWEQGKRCLGSANLAIDYDNCGEGFCFATYQMWEVGCTWRRAEGVTEGTILVDGVSYKILDAPPPGWNETTTRALPRRAAVAVVDAAKQAA